MVKIWIGFCTLIGSLLLVGAILFFAVPDYRSFPADILVKEEKAVKGEDAIVLLQGDAIDRVPFAAKLYKNGFGKKIVFVESESSRLMELNLRPFEGQMVYDYLTKILKVPAEDIVFNQSTRVTSTQEEARELLKLIERQKFHRVILTTSWYHSGRASWIFARQNKSKNLTIATVPTPTPDNWYRDEHNFLMVYEEYLKLFHNVMRYGIFS